MHSINYLKFNKIRSSDFLSLLNSDKLRKHLIQHALFTAETMTVWMNDKMAMDAIPGCRVRAITHDGELVGWCGIQLDNDSYEIAIVIAEAHWGLGKRVFHDVMNWARELEHHELYIHLLQTRPVYKFLKKIAKHVYESEVLGSKFMSYQLIV